MKSRFIIDFFFIYFYIVTSQWVPHGGQVTAFRTPPLREPTPDSHTNLPYGIVPYGRRIPETYTRLQDPQNPPPSEGFRPTIHRPTHTHKPTHHYGHRVPYNRRRTPTYMIPSYNAHLPPTVIVEDLNRGKQPPVHPITEHFPAMVTVERETTDTNELSTTIPQENSSTQKPGARFESPTTINKETLSSTSYRSTIESSSAAPNSGYVETSTLYDDGIRGETSTSSYATNYDDKNSSRLVPNFDQDLDHSHTSDDRFIHTPIGEVDAQEAGLIMYFLLLVCILLLLCLGVVAGYWISARCEIRRLDTKMRRACIDGLDDRHVDDRL